MPKYKLEIYEGNNLTIDKLSFTSNNDSVVFASSMLKKDLGIQKIIIIRTDPFDKNKTIISRDESN